MRKSFNKNPLVSVIMPVYNGSNFVAEAIESVLNQDYKNLELIVVNDGSTDNTLLILRQYQSFPQVKIISYKNNKGESAAANIGFKASRGEFIARMDADDICRVDRISKQVKFMLANSETIVLGTQADVINEEGKITGKKTFPFDHKSIYETYGIFHPMLHPSCMFRRSLLPNQKQLWEDAREPNDDYYTLFRFLKFGKFANLKESLIGYRIHSNNKSLQHVRQKVLHAMQIRIDAIRYFGYRPTVKAVVINIVQLIGICILPERFILLGYFVLRGITSPKPNISPTKRIAVALQEAFSIAF